MRMARFGRGTDGSSRRETSDGRVRRRSGSRLLVALVAVALVATGMVTAYADDPAGSGFLIDGTVADAGATQFEDGFGNEKELGPENGNTTKLGVIHTDPLPTLGLTNPNGQVDLRNVWFDTNTANGTDWLYFAWERDSNKGSGVIAIEFQAAAAPVACDYTGSEADLISGCNPWTNRAAGDFILIWDQVGNDIEISIRVFDGTAFGEKDTLDVHEADAALSADNTRGEAVIDLAVVFGNTQECVSIANVIPGTLTGNSDEADYKDTVLADIASAITISNCGSVQITKTDDAGAALSGVTFALYTDDGDADFDDETAATGFQGEALECTTTASGTCTILKVPFDDYWLNETNLDTTSYAADPDLPEKVSVTNTTTVTLSYVNPRLRGSILVEKLLAGTSTRVDGASFVIDEDGDGDLETGTQTTIPQLGTETGLYCIDDLLFADYVVVEASPPTGYEAASGFQTVAVDSASECSDRNGEGDSPDASFTNRKIPTLTTSADETGVVVGNDISDTATLAEGANTPTGTITFDLYDNDQCSGDPVYTTSVTVDSGNGDYGPVSYTATAPGTYYWIASYDGDASNTGATGACGDDGEVDTVVKASPTISTSADQTVTIGSSISDTATVSGGYNPTGTVTFDLYDNDQCSGDPIHTATEALSSGTAGPVSFTPTAPGTYYWIATYNGDDNNNTDAGECGDDGEVDTVAKAQPSLSTTPTWLPNDDATLTGGFGTLGGTLTFTLYDNATCDAGEDDANVLYTEDVSVSGTGTYGTSNTTVSVTTDGTYSWEVSYDGDGNNGGAFSACDQEQTTIDITPLGE